MVNLYGMVGNLGSADKRYRSMDWLILAYIGPETILPIASALASIVGAVLMFGRRLWGLLTRLVRAVFRKGA
ncbi:MAG TPA: hypothetical protein DEO88_08565 [Syntrophobacteraceae bacterium]|nr:hypothetical protein [Syntrophobacteraceae bacterium]